MIKLPHLLAFSLCALLLHSCAEKSPINQISQTGTSETFLSTIQTEKAVLSNQQEELILMGKVTYDPDRLVSYTPLINGIVAHSRFSVGDKVEQGQSLLDIRSSDLNGMRMEYVTAEAELKVVEREAQSASALFEDQLLSEKDFLETQASLKQAHAAYERVKNDLYPYRYNENGTFSIKSPLSGYIIEKKATAGASISADNDPLFTIAELSVVWIVANVYASNAQFVKEGMEVEISTLSYPGEIFKANINHISQVFDAEEKVLKARIIIANPELKLKPEMSAVVHLKSEMNQQLVSIPTEALVFDNNKNFVVIQDLQGSFQAREVQIKGQHGSISYITSGVDVGENVVTNNQLLIYSGLNQKQLCISL